MESIPTVENVVRKANIPSDPESPFQDLSSYQVYKCINEYYKNSDTDVRPLRFRIKDKSTGSQIKETESSLYSSSLIDLDEFEDMKITYSQYNKKGVELAGLDSKDIWNGESCIIRFNDGCLEFGETDYYTSCIFSRLLYVEAARVLDEYDGDISNIDTSELSLRNTFLHDKEDFYKTPTLSTGGSAGGVIFGKKDGEWNIMLARRSDKPRVNQGKVSIVPNGGIEYSDFEYEDTFLNTVRREFSEEVFSSPSEGKEFFDRKVSEEICSTGWILRTGSLAVGYCLYVEDFETISNPDGLNFEFSETIEIPVNDTEDVLSNIGIKTMSPSTIAIVCRALNKFDENKQLPDLPYSIEEVR